MNLFLRSIVAKNAKCLIEYIYMHTFRHLYESEYKHRFWAGYGKCPLLITTGSGTWVNVSRSTRAHPWHAIESRLFVVPVTPDRFRYESVVFAHEVGWSPNNVEEPNGKGYYHHHHRTYAPPASPGARNRHVFRGPDLVTTVAGNKRTRTTLLRNDRGRNDDTPCISFPTLRNANPADDIFTSDIAIVFRMDGKYVQRTTPPCTHPKRVGQPSRLAKLEQASFKNGYKSLIDENGNIYRGEWKNDMKHG